jgi:hypothetical protein
MSKYKPNKKNTKLTETNIQNTEIRFTTASDVYSAQLKNLSQQFLKLQNSRKLF